MQGCAHCGSPKLIFICEHCNEWFCRHHHPPSAHDCADQPPSHAVEEWPSRRYLLLVVGLFTLAGVLLIGLSAGPALMDSSLLPGADQGAADQAPHPTLNTTQLEWGVHAAINDRRRQHDEPALRHVPSLGVAASRHSGDMAANNFTGHVSPTNGTLATRLDRVNYPCSQSAELVLYTWFDRPLQVGGETVRYSSQSELTTGIVSSWARSTPHNAVLLQSAWTSQGVGIAVTPENKVFATVVFCNSTSTAPSVTASS